MGVLSWHVGIETRQLIRAMWKYNLFVISKCDNFKIMNSYFMRNMMGVYGC